MSKFNNILDFIKNKFKSQETTVDNPQVVEFDDVAPRNKSEVLDGMHEKSFVLFPIDHLEKLTNELRDNPDCSYQTCFGDKLKDVSNCPKYIPVMLKSFGNAKKYVYNEILASRICNEMGVPTVYNTSYTDGDKEYLLSVDFLPHGERILDMEDLVYEVKDYEYFNIEQLLSCTHNVSDDLFDIFEVLHMNKSRGRNSAWKYDKTKYYEDFIMHYLVRTYIIKDMDFFPKNCCNIVDKDNNMRFGPMYDCEIAFSLDVRGGQNIASIAYIKKHYPEIFAKFCQRYNALMDRKTLNKLFADIDNKEYVKTSKKYLQDCYNNFDNVCIYANYHNENEKY